MQIETAKLKKIQETCLSVLGEGHTNENVASALGISLEGLLRVFNGQKVLSSKLLQKMVNRFGIDPLYVYQNTLPAEASPLLKERYTTQGSFLQLLQVPSPQTLMAFGGQVAADMLRVLQRPVTLSSRSTNTIGVAFQTRAETVLCLLLRLDKASKLVYSLDRGEASPLIWSKFTLLFYNAFLARIEKI